MPHGSRPIKDRERALYRRVPRGAARSCAAAVYAGRELLVLGFAKRPRLLGLLEQLVALAHAQADLRPGAAERR